MLTRTNIVYRWGWLDEREQKRAYHQGQHEDNEEKRGKGRQRKKGSEKADTIDQISMLKFKFLENGKRKSQTAKNCGERQKASSRRRERKKVIVLHCSKRFLGGRRRSISRACAENGGAFF